MRLLVFAIKFLLIGAFFIVSNQNLALIDTDNRNDFVEQYKEWIFSLGREIGTLTAYVVKVEWLPESEETKVENIKVKNR